MGMWPRAVEGVQGMPYVLSGKPTGTPGWWPGHVAGGLNGGGGPGKPGGGVKCGWVKGKVLVATGDAATSDLRPTLGSILPWLLWVVMTVVVLELENDVALESWRVRAVAGVGFFLELLASLFLEAAFLRAAAGRAGGGASGAWRDSPRAKSPNVTDK
jgi:hypothetical protein